MERAPLDVLDIIFGLACTDNETTGCWLAAVSRTIRDASASFWYQAIALHGPRQITAFLSLLSKPAEPAGFAERVKTRLFKKGTSARRLPPVTIRVEYLFVVDRLWRTTQDGKESAP